MKRHLPLMLVLLLALTIGVFALPASASLGQAATILSEDVCLIKTGLLGEKLVFRDTDFKEALGVSRLKSITFTSLPSSTEGTLFLNGRRLSEGQTVKRSSLGALVFVPLSAEVTDATFTFTAEGLSGGATHTCHLRFIDKINYAPTIEDNSLAVRVSTQSGVGLHGQMAGSDPEGDACRFIVLSYPKHGRLTVLDASTGAYRYTPSGSYTGKDSFSYVVRDEYGNYSDVASVSLTVNRRATDVVYVDMTDRAEYNAALMLTVSGVMSGELIGDDTYFHPDETVKRAEFIAMALKTVGIRADSTLHATFFDDNDQIPASLVGYVATAQKLGIVNGSFDGTSLNVRPNDEMTLCEAAIVLSSLLGRGADFEVSAIEDSSVPVWARTDVAVMYEVGIFDTALAPESLSRSITRAEAAEMLYRLSALK